MVRHESHTILQFIARCLVPSAMSASLCALCSIFGVGIHLLLLSVAAGTSLPTLLDGKWATFYTNTVVQPIDTLLNNSAFIGITTTVLWGSLGLLVYSLIELIVNLYHEERSSEQDLQQGQLLLRHPMRHSYFITLIWRASVLMLAFAFFVAMLPTPATFLQTDAAIVAGHLDLTTSLQRLGVTLIGWTILGHCFVVFLRLFLLRPRLFGHMHIEPN